VPAPPQRHISSPRQWNPSGLQLCSLRLTYRKRRASGTAVSAAWSSLPFRGSVGNHAADAGGTGSVDGQHGCLWRQWIRRGVVSIDIPLIFLASYRSATSFGAHKGRTMLVDDTANQTRSLHTLSMAHHCQLTQPRRCHGPSDWHSTADGPRRVRCYGEAIRRNNDGTWQHSLLSR
jgi:hypothetical protein